MFITYLIGNGFDLGVGLDTRYRDFLKYYLRKKGSTETIQNGKTIIREQMAENIDTWADMEVALGKLPPHFNGPDEYKAFLSLYDDILHELSTYFTRQEQRVDLHKHADLIINDFTSAFMHPCSHLQAEEAQGIVRVWNKLMEHSLHFAFISFNYTTVFDHCLSLLSPSGLRHQLNTTTYMESLNQVIHIHGAVNDNMILGVNDVSQISGGESVHESIRNALIKPQINSVVHQSSILKAERYIRYSQIIVIYGMSIGPTDRQWWSLLCDWLRKDEFRYLIVYVRKEDYDPCNSRHVVAATKDTRERFCQGYKGDKLPDNVLRRILVVVNRNLFTLKLVVPTARAQP